MSELLSERVIIAANDVVLSRGGLKSNYERLFGTPEKAAQTIAAIGGQYPCDEGAEDCDACPLNEAPCRLNRDKPEESKLLEWLKGEA